MPDILDREAARHLVDRQELGVVLAAAAVGARRPADERQVVHQRLGQVAARAKLGDRCRAVPLRQRRVVGPEHERQVRELRRREPERLIEQDLPRRIRDVILAADHVRHLHQRIVDHDGEVVLRPAVGAHDDEIADDLGAEDDLAAHEILKPDVLGLPARESG